MEENSITLIIPTYNHSETLERAIKSVYYLDFNELIIVDDGSDENHKKIINEIMKNYPNLILLTHSSNQGLAETKNTGFNKSTSKWAMTLDDDDYYIRNAIDNLKEFIIIHPEADIIHHKIKNYDPWNKETKEWGVETFTLEEIKENNRITGTSLIKKDTWNKLNGFKNIPYEDWEFWIRAKEANFNFLFFPEIFYMRIYSGTGLECRTKKQITVKEWKEKYVK